MVVVIKVFQSSTGSFGVKAGGSVGAESQICRAWGQAWDDIDLQVHQGYKRGIEDCPDDVEFPLQSLNSDWSDLDNCEDNQHRLPIEWIIWSEIPMKLKIQFVAVPIAAPFVLIASELISVG